jgi:hypothetical protein
MAGQQGGRGWGTALALLVLGGGTFWVANSCFGFLSDKVHLPQFPFCKSPSPSPPPVTTTTKGTTTTTTTVPTSTAPLSIPPQSPGSATVGVPFSYRWSANGGTPPYTWTATGLPAGITLSSSGVMSGTATTSGTYTLTIRVRDASGRTAIQTVHFTVSAVVAQTRPGGAITVTPVSTTFVSPQIVGVSVGPSQIGMPAIATLTLQNLGSAPASILIAGTTTLNGTVVGHWTPVTIIVPAGGTRTVTIQTEGTIYRGYAGRQLTATFYSPNIQTLKPVSASFIPAAAPASA